MFRSTSLRLAALYTTAFAISVVMLGMLTLYTTRQELADQFDRRIRAESAALAQEYRSEGLTGVMEAVRERDLTARRPRLWPARTGRRGAGGTAGRGARPNGLVGGR